MVDRLATYKDSFYRRERVCFGTIVMGLKISQISASTRIAVASPINGVPLTFEVSRPTDRMTAPAFLLDRR
jgi:hypothetical protein